MSITRYHIELDDKTVSMRIEGSLEDRLRGNIMWFSDVFKMAIVSGSRPELYPNTIYIQGLSRQKDEAIDDLSFLTHKNALAYYNKVVATLEAWSKYCEELKG